MTINASTKIAAILKQHPDAIEAIISISPKFEKLRNPILRKLMAGRASIAMASTICGCTINSFFEKLRPLGFKIAASTQPGIAEKIEVPEFVKSLKKEQLVELDVRPVIASGKDPLNIITDKIKSVKVGQVLKIINIFKPVPLMLLLEKQGFDVYADAINDNLVETYFYKKTIASENNLVAGNNVTEGWDETLLKYNEKLIKLDVRHLEMPQPMIAILDAVDDLPCGSALFVYHKRIPVFLLPELRERNFDYRIKEIRDGEVQLLIFKTSDV